MLVKEIKARKVPDSRNEPTIEVTVNGQKASSPSGKSKGKHETPSYHLSLEWNIKAINSLKIPFDINYFNDLSKIESFLTKKFKLKSPKDFGANALFALESAILKAIAKENKKQLWQVIAPNAKRMLIPLGNAIGGGLHSSMQKDAPEFQEFLLIPKAKTIRENVMILDNSYKRIKKLIKSKSKNDEGAWRTSLSNEEILSVLSKLKKISIGVDIAASSFYKNNYYHYKNKSLNRNAQISYINSLIKDYALYYIEDPLYEEDFKGFSSLIKSGSHLITGDDITATQISRLKKAISLNSINAMIIKPNQNGSLIELKKIFEICKKNNIKTIISHRSGETLDSALADYAFGFQADFIKTGISTKWRKAKLKRLIEIEAQLK